MYETMLVYASREVTKAKGASLHGHRKRRDATRHSSLAVK